MLVQALSEASPDAILVTGDVAHDPEPTCYRRFTDILREYYAGPSLCLAGNHDVASAMGQLLEPSTLLLPGWCLVALDSHIDDTVAAEVSTDDWARVLAALQQHRDRWAIVATHHPPLDIDCPWLDKDRIQNADELLESLAERPNVKGLVFGHAHQVIEAEYRDIPLLGTPSTCFQFAPRSAEFGVDEQLPGYRWLTLSPDGQVASEVRRLLDYPLHIDLSDR